MLEYLPFLKRDFLVDTTPTGLKIYRDLYSICKVSKCRDVVICKSNGLYFLTDVFNMRTIEQYSKEIVTFITGVMSIEDMSNFLLQVLKEDRDFYCWFYNFIMLEGISSAVGVHLINKLKSIISDSASGLKENGLEVLCIDGADPYFVVRDLPGTLVLPRDIKLEALTHAKAWNGDFSIR